MKFLLKLPMLIIFVVALVIAVAFVARATGLWPASEPTRGRPHQGVP